MTRARPLLAALALLGCGAVARRSADGGAGDGSTAPDVVAACPPRVSPGLACAAGARPCLGDDGCNDCFCNGGAWVCGSRVCADAGACPSGRPRTGDACTNVGQACSYGAGCAGAECLCAGGRWTCDAFFCPDR